MYEHPSGLPHAYDRASSAPTRARVVFVEQGFVQGADLNEVQSLEARRNMRVANLVASDGDRVTDASIIIDASTGTLTLSSGQIFVRGDVRPISAATITGVSMTGTVLVGVRLVTTTTTYLDDPSLLGLDPGTWAEGQPGAGRQAETISWALSTDGGAGDFYTVYTLVNGAVIDQTPPPALSGVNAAIAAYDRDANGNYVVSGCEVTALGKTGSVQNFSVQAGVANINGFKRSRNYALRIQQTETPDLEAVAAEPHTYTGSDPITITVNRPPISAVTSLIIVKQVTETVTRGLTPGGSDALQHASVVSIVSVVQGGTTFTPTTDYTLGADSVSWAPSGAEPAASSTYTVTYRYNASVSPSSVTATSLTVSGGVSGTTVLVSYLSKLPRIDLICLDDTGNTAYVAGISARYGALAPLTPSNLLKLAEVSNDWLNMPVVKNNATHNFTYDQQVRLFNRLISMLDEFDRFNLVTAATAGNPVAKQGIFTDTFADDSYRDQGSTQTAATVNGSLQLAIDLLSTARFLTAPASMTYTEEVVVRQELATSQLQINPYATLTRMPSALVLEPPTDYFTDSETVWTSPTTQEFASASAPPVSSASAQITSTTITEVVSTRSEVATQLRQILVNFTLKGFGVGEILSTLTFDGVSVLPPGTLTANSAGQITGSFTIPAGVPTGSRLVAAVGAAGSYATAYFVGDGEIDVTTMQSVTLVQRIAPTVINNITNITNVTNVTSVDNSTAGHSSPAGNASGEDPLAETFTLSEDRCIVGVDFKIMAFGDKTRGIRVQLTPTLAGVPYGDAIAEVFVDVSSLTAGQWVQARFAAPVFVPAGVERAIVLMTDDPNHAVAIAKLGDVDTTTQTFVSAQPYTVGVLLASSNHSTWTPINDGDLTFRIVAASFSATSVTVSLGTLALATATDLIARWTADVPNVACACRVEMVRADGTTVVQMAADQTVSFTDFITETVTFRAVLTGTTKVAPTLFPGVMVGVGKLRTTGTYVTKAFTMGSPVEVDGVVNAYLPSGASLTMDCDAADNSWNSMASVSSILLGAGWTEMKYRKTSFTATQGRVRLTLNGTPAARPVLTGLRAYSF